MRSKLLSLHLILTILKSHADLFVDPLVCIPSNTSMEMTPFLQATKQYLCLSLSRNAVSPVNQVFELSVEIFWCMLKSMRAQMKVGQLFSLSHHVNEGVAGFSSCPLRTCSAASTREIRGGAVATCGDCC